MDECSTSRGLSIYWVLGEHGRGGQVEYSVQSANTLLLL